jgi:RNA polymerase sigma factor (sigma-70 family)
MTETEQLLAEYARNGSEEAFRELVERYINLVHSTALRLMHGDEHLAKDIAQTVFLHLARNAGKLAAGAMLGGWLHRDTCFVAQKYLRQEHRRRNREQQAAFMDSLPDHSQANLDRVAPILDEAINALGEAERTAILLRFFEQRDFRSVGLALGSNEDAARMRVGRALDRLHGMLKRRGVTISVAALAAGLSGEAVTAAPTGLGAAVAAGALGSAAAGGVSTIIGNILSMTKLKMAVAGSLIVGGLTVPMVIQHQDRQRAEEENRQLRQAVQDLTQANESWSNRVAQLSLTSNAPGDQERELLRLRGQVGNLNRQLAEAAKMPLRTAAAPPSENKEAIKEEAKWVGIAKLNYTRTWVLTFMLYADKNQGQFPTNFAQAVAFWPSDAKAPTAHDGEMPMQPYESVSGTSQYGLNPENYDIVYQGALNSLNNPSSTIVIREREAMQAPNGGWVKAYAFADGHSEIHRSEDGNFEPWEKQHQAELKPSGSNQAGF